MGEHIDYEEEWINDSGCSNHDESGDPSSTKVGEQEVTQSSELSKNEMTPQQLRRSERIQKSNSKYVNTAITEDEVKEPETYEEASHNMAWQQAMEEEIIPLEQNQTWELVQRPGDVKSIFCKWIYKIKVYPRWINREIQGSDCSSMVLSTIWTRL